MYEITLRYKWICDGISSIDEGIERLKGKIFELEEIKRLGGKVDIKNNEDDYIRFYGENPDLKKELDFEDECDEEYM